MEDYKLKLVDPAKSREFFEKKVAFTLGPAEVKYFRDEGERFNIIDVRKAEDYEKEHVPGAINLPEEKWESLNGLSKDRPNIVYCYSVVCHLAARGALYFASQGYPVLEMDGGFDYWKEYEYETESGSERTKKSA